MEGPVKVNGKTFNGIMPAHGGILDDHAIASIATYIRTRFGNNAGNVSAPEVKAVRDGTAMQNLKAR
jgi:mono/diheme cytochrome c family protein